MILWNIVAVILIVLVLVEAYRNDWRLPKFASWAIVGALWFAGSFALHLIQSAGL